MKHQHQLSISISELDITTSGEINISNFLDVSDDERAGFKGIEIQLSYKSDADQKEIDTWLEGVNKRCPVKYNLLYPTPINIIASNN